MGITISITMDLQLLYLLWFFTWKYPLISSRSRGNFLKHWKCLHSKLKKILWNSCVRKCKACKIFEHIKHNHQYANKIQKNNRKLYIFWKYYFSSMTYILYLEFLMYTLSFSYFFLFYFHSLNIIWTLISCFDISKFKS